MTISEKILSLNELGSWIRSGLKDYQEKINIKKTEPIVSAIEQIQLFNGWFTPTNVYKALEQWADLLTTEKLTKWTSHYDFEKKPNQTVAVIMAGNLPMVGFHDALCVLLSPHNLLVKFSSDDDKLIPLLFTLLFHLDERWKNKIQIADGQLTNFDAVIATGSDNSARYFNYYFKKHPHIIRKNRTSLAVINGNETVEEMKLLADDVFQYFGQGCRNVGKLLLPAGYDLDKIFEGFFPYKDIINHSQYSNNYEYHKAIFLMNKEPIWENGFVMLKEDEALHSPLSCLFYHFYSDEKEVFEYLEKYKENLQCVVGNTEGFVPFGTTQQPQLMEYADKVDVMNFLTELT